MLELDLRRPNSTGIICFASFFTTFRKENNYKPITFTSNAYKKHTQETIIVHKIIYISKYC